MYPIPHARSAIGVQVKFAVESENLKTSEGPSRHALSIFQRPQDSALNFTLMKSTRLNRPGSVNLIILKSAMGLLDFLQ